MRQQSNINIDRVRWRERHWMTLRALFSPHPTSKSYAGGSTAGIGTVVEVERPWEQLNYNDEECAASRASAGVAGTFSGAWRATNPYHGAMIGRNLHPFRVLPLYLCRSSKNIRDADAWRKIDQCPAA